jgi:pectate lyase
VNGGTTGGAGGTSITVSTGAQLTAAVDAHRGVSTPLTVFVDGTITPANSSESDLEIKDNVNLSIIGVGTRGELNGIGFKISGSSNIIIQNLRIHHVTSGQKDAVGIQENSHHIWIDHNEMYNQFQGVGEDDYDGLVDAKSGSQYITVSYNYLHDSWKTSLNGSSDSDSGNRFITYHNNRWINVNSRTPFIRFGEGHIYNNYYEGIASTGINLRMGNQSLVENNHLANSQNVLVACFSPQPGFWNARGNKYENVAWVADSTCLAFGKPVGTPPSDTGEASSTTTYEPRQQHAGYNYTLLPADQVKANVEACAGVGRVNCR